MNQGGVLHIALDALPSEVALVDSSGTILFANWAWRNSAAPLSHANEVGESFLNTCSRYLTENECDRLKYGFNAIASGPDATFCLDYQCSQSADWYRLRCSQFKPTSILAESASEVEKKAERVVLVLHESITEFKQAEIKYKGLFENSPAGMFQTTRDGQYIRVNMALARMYGYRSPEELITAFTDIGRQLYADRSRRADFVKQLESGDQISGFEAQIHRKDGSIIWIAESARAVRDSSGNLLYYEGLVENISERKRIEERLAHGAFHDTLTQLPNRALFMDRLRHVIDRQKRREEYLFAVLFLDLDRFKVINDSLGHAAGDTLLVEASKRLQSCIRLDDTIARLGGDEFTILLEDIGGLDEAVQVAERIQKEISRPMEIAGNQIFCTASIGIAMCSPEIDRPDVMLSNADTAMYRAKAQGKARYEIFNQTMQAGVMSQLQIQTDLRKAIDQNELSVYYQPIIALDNHVLVGFEALVRWIHPVIGMISPAEFIPLAEEVGLIHPIGMWVLRESCRQMLAWEDELPEAKALTISVNLSTRQFSQPNLHEQIGQVISETGFPAERLKLEITESAIMQNATSNALAELKALGLQLVIDDFGTGYSSLSYLHRLPIDALKIDRSFVNQMGDIGKKAEIVRTIMTLARNLELSVVAEGIEKRHQLEHLQQLGCPLGQGYLFSKPVEAGSARKLIGAPVLQ